MAAGDRRCQALAALTAAALGLPGIGPRAAQPSDQAHATVQVGLYREGGARIDARILHLDAGLPLPAGSELTLEIDQDIYSGATPSFSVPAAMTGRPKQQLGQQRYTPADVISAASPVLGTFEITNSMQGYKAFQSALLDYLLRSPPAEQTVQGGLAAGYAAVLEAAIPTGDPVRPVMTAQPSETRNQLRLGLTSAVDQASLSVSGGLSDEPDFKSHFVSLALGLELPGAQTRIDLDYALTFNQIERSRAHGDVEHVHDGDVAYPELRERSREHRAGASASRILSKNTLVQLGVSHARQRGYLSNPYKLVYIRGEITPEEYAAMNLQQAVFQDVTELQVAGVELFHEVRPRKRNLWNISTRLRHHVDRVDAAIHLDYSLFRDDWHITAHTLEAQWHQPLPGGIVVAPRIRFYSQSAADFYAPYFLAPREDGLYSSDYRLSAYGTLSGGVSLDALLGDDAHLQAGFEYKLHRGGLGLGDGGSAAFDFDALMVHAAIELPLESSASPRRVAAHGHRTHAHSAATTDHRPHPLIPSGIQFAHGLNRAGDWMLGYHFMRRQDEDRMLHGRHGAADAELASRACVDQPCTHVPSRKLMHMHMLHLMYAPTSWLTLSLMPSLHNMRMQMRPLDGTTASDLHTHEHRSDGLGDTQIGALASPVDVDGHRLQLGLALSIPSGALDATLEDATTRSARLQGYAMQRGSGTFDLTPSITYTFANDVWTLGAQLLATRRLEERNASGYRLGDRLQSALWAGARLSDQVGATLRGSWTWEDDIQGVAQRANAGVSPGDHPTNHGHELLELGLGLTLRMPHGRFDGHTLSAEWVEPIRQDLRGYQIERGGTLNVSWQYHF
ncbi:MAG: DUF3570 domain-containing protein [Gammaproteobacteria bacterium]|nr:DUF3570 domain-containing protein [Gammaproteobacteria bacterium]